jgi:hypothetical protein
MLTSQTFMSSRKCGARDLEKGCWTKRCHGVALREPTRLFSGRLPEANRFIGDAAWFSRRMSLNCEVVLLKSVDFNVEPPLETVYPLIAAKTLAKLNHVDYAG